MIFYGFGFFYLILRSLCGWVFFVCGGRVGGFVVGGCLYRCMWWEFVLGVYNVGGESGWEYYVFNGSSVVYCERSFRVDSY